MAQLLSYMAGSQVSPEAEAGDLLTEAAQRAFHQHASPYFHVPIRKGSPGALASLAGAAVSIMGAIE